MPQSCTRRLAILVALVVAIPGSARAAVTLTVPGDFPTITLALEAAASGDTVLVSAGTYPECVTVTGLDDLELIGKRGAIIDASGCGTAITIADGTGALVKGFAITGATDQGILVQPAASEAIFTKITIRDAAATPALSVLENGVSVIGASDITLDDVDVGGATVHAVYVESATATVIKRCSIRDAIGDGIRVDLGSGVKIEKNVMQNLLGPAIFFFHDGGIGMLGGAVESLVVKNKILANPGGGITVGGANNLIEKNNVVDSGTTGIDALSNGGGSIYRKNKVTRSAAAGIRAGGTDDFFEKNGVKESLGNGIEVTGISNEFSGTKVIEAAGTGWVIAPLSSDNDFTSCSSTKAGGDGFRVEGTLNFFVKVVASGSGGLDLNDPAGVLTTNQYIDCKFKTSNLP